MQLFPSVPLVKFDIWQFQVARNRQFLGFSGQDYQSKTNRTRGVIKLRTSLSRFATKCLYQEENSWHPGQRGTGAQKNPLAKKGEIAPTPSLTLALLGISSPECFFGTPGRRSRQQLGKRFLLVLNIVAFPTRGAFLESPDRFSGPERCFILAAFAFKFKVSIILKMMQ